MKTSSALKKFLKDFSKIKRGSSLRDRVLCKEDQANLCRHGWESDGKDKYKDPEDLSFLQQKEIECREELIALCSDKDQFGVLIASEHRYIGETQDILGHSNEALTQFNIFVEKEDSKNNNYLEQAVSYYTRARHYAETRRDYHQALKDSLEARTKVELEQKGGATVAKRGLSVEQQKERMYQRKSMHFKVFCQQYDIYNKMGENQLANTRLNMAHKLASSYKLTDELFYFVHLIGNQKMNDGDYNQAEKLFQNAYAMRDNISKDNKKNYMFDLYYDWSKSKVGKLDMEGAYEMAIEAHYTKPNDEDAKWITRALLLYKEKKKDLSGDRGQLSLERKIRLTEDLADLYSDMYHTLDNNQRMKKCIVAAVGQYERVMELITKSDSKQLRNEHVGKIYAAVGYNTELLGDYARAVEMYQYAINETDGKEQFSHFESLVDIWSTLHQTEPELIYKEMDSYKSTFSRNKQMEYKFTEKLKSVKVENGDDVIEEAMKLTELEDFAETVELNIDAIADDDIQRQIEEVVIPCSTKEIAQSKFSKNKVGETILQEKIVKLKAGVTAQKIEEIRRMIEVDGHPVNVSDNAGLTPLHEAANLGLPKIAEILLKNGANIDQKTKKLDFKTDGENDEDGSHAGQITPLQDACDSLNMEVYEVLLSKLETIQVLIKNNPNCLVRNIQGKTPLQCFSSQMETIFRNPEYSPFLTERDQSKFKNVQKALSIKTVNQENDPKFRDKSHESTVTHIPSRSAEAYESRSSRPGTNQKPKPQQRELQNSHRPIPKLDKNPSSRSDRLLAMEQNEFLPLSSSRTPKSVKRASPKKIRPPVEMSDIPGQPTLFDKLQGRQSVKRRGSSNKRAMIQEDSSDEELPSAKIIKIESENEDEEEAFLKATSSKSPSNRQLFSRFPDSGIENLPFNRLHDSSPSKTSTISSSSMTSVGSNGKKLSKFRLQFEQVNGQMTTVRVFSTTNVPLSSLIEKARQIETVAKVIRTKKTENVNLEPCFVICVQCGDSLDELPSSEKIEDVIDFAEKENEKLVLKITEWRKVRLRFEDRFKQHLLDETKSTEVDEEFQSILSTVSLSGQIGLKGNINPNYLSAIVSSISHHAVTEINFAGVNVSSISDKLADGFSKAKNLNKVILESCHLTKDLIGQMKVENSNVKELDLSSNQLGDCGKELASFLKGFTSLRSLKLARNRITHKTLECYDLNFTNLRCLNLSLNIGIGSTGIIWLKNLLSQESSIENLQISQITKRGDSILNPLGELVEESLNSLKELNISKNFLNDDDLTDFGDILGQYTEVEKINLSSNRDLTKKSIIELLENVKSLSEITVTCTSVKSMSEIEHCPAAKEKIKL